MVIALRPPKDAIASEYINRVGRHMPMSLPKLLYRCKHFYSQATRYASHVVISPFESTTGHPEAVVAALRNQANMELNANLKLSKSDVLEDVERLNAIHVGDSNELTVARPSEARAELARRIKQHLVEKHDPELEHLQSLHDALVASPTAVRWQSSASNDSETLDT